MIKPLSKMGIKGTYLSIIKAMYSKSTDKIIFNGEKQKAFPLRSGTWQGACSVPSVWQNIGSPSQSN